MMAQTKNEERRSFMRIEVPGAQVKYKLPTKLRFMKNFSATAEVENVSKSGISFNAAKDIEKGSTVDMRLSFPDGKSIELKGKVRWEENETVGQERKIGVLFNPFGQHKDYNSMSALEYLREMKDQAIDLDDKE